MKEKKEIKIESMGTSHENKITEKEDVMRLCV